VDDLLARPVSPGALVLLLPSSREARVTARWIESLAHSDPRVRLIAARLLAQSHPPSAVDPLKRSLSVETDHFVAAEQARTLLETAADADATVIDAAARLKDNGLTATLGRLRGIRAFGHFDRVKEQCGSPAAAALIGAIVEMTPAALSTLPPPVVADDAALEAALVAAIMVRTAPQGDWVTTVLAGRSPKLRTLTWWSIAVSVDAESVAASVKTASNAAVGEESPALRLGRLLTLRAIGQTVDDDVVHLMTQAATDEQLPPTAATAIRDGAIVRLLSDREQQNVPPAFRGGRVPPQPAAPGSPPVTYNQMRIVDGLPRGLITDVMAVSGCKLNPRDALAGALVTYGSTGQPSKLALAASELPQDCRDAVQVLVITSLLGQDGSASPDSTDAVLVPLDPEFDQCLDPLSDSVDGRPQTHLAPLRVGASIKPPAKTKDVRPSYPKEAQARHVTGTVIIETTISTEGCIKRAAIVRGVHPLLDVEALRSVMQWKFVPTLVEGVPYPVLMTVTVQFTLQ